MLAESFSLISVCFFFYSPFLLVNLFFQPHCISVRGMLGQELILNLWSTTHLCSSSTFLRIWFSDLATKQERASVSLLRFSFASVWWWAINNYRVSFFFPFQIAPAHRESINRTWANLIRPNSPNSCLPTPLLGWNTADSFALKISSRGTPN